MKADISRALGRNRTARCVIVVASALSLLTGAPMGAFAMQIASGNPVCAAIKAEGGSCAGYTDVGGGGGGGGGNPAQNPIKDFWPKNFPRVDQSGPSAQTAPDLSPGMLGGHIESKPKRQVCRKNHKLICPTEPL